MKILKNLFRNLFKSRRDQIIITLTNKDLIVTAGSWCPNCKNDGALFHYTHDKPIYICENCCKNFSGEEYNRLLLIAQRKQKLDKINEQIVNGRNS